MIHSKDDEHVDLAPGESLADNAIYYLLLRINRDADMRWFFAHTESFHRLCVAHAQRAGRPVEEIKTKFLTPPNHLRDDKPRIPMLQARVSDLEKQLEGRGGPEPCSSFDGGAYEDVHRALDLCPACAGVPVDSINRCGFCKAILRAIS